MSQPQFIDGDPRTLPGERLYVYWPTLPAPVARQIVTLPDGRTAVVDSANLDGLGLHRRKLTVIVCDPPERSISGVTES